MLDHIDIGTTDYEKSRDFYVACLAPLDIQLVMEIETCLASLPRAFAFVSKNRELGKKTLVHCRQGRDRTGMFMAYCICKQYGVSPEDAIRQLKELRHDALAAEGWREFTLEVLHAC